MLQVWVVTGCIRYSLGVAGAVTSQPLPPPLDHPHLHELITRQHTRVSLQRSLLILSPLFNRSLSLFLFVIFSYFYCESSASIDLLTTCWVLFLVYYNYISIWQDKNWFEYLKNYIILKHFCLNLVNKKVTMIGKNSCDFMIYDIFILNILL